MLIHFGVIPYLVFDGDYLPSKAGTEKERAQKRRDSKKLGLELLKMGKTSQAHLELQKAVDVTPEMARRLIEELKYHGIQYVVAPYEADSQLAYMERKGIINAILSEDSDLLVFGAKCLITKLDKYGECVEINRNLFTACKEISLVSWSDADFRRMAMLSGCDYLPGIGKMGLKTAHRMLRKHKTVDRVVRAAQFDGQYKVPTGFMDDFLQAENTFLYQWVFCPLSNQLVNLTTPDSGVDVSTMPYIGKHVPSDIAIGVANGNLHPHTKEPIAVEAMDRSRGNPLRPTRSVTTSAQTPASKYTKPIDAFFKPKRTPLAELDPNSFTPSPSQQTLMEQQQQNSGGWAAVLAPTSSSRLQHSSTSPRRAPLTARRTTSAPAHPASAPSRAKRQRLCSAGLFNTPGSGIVEAGRSRFFNASVPEPSPSLRTANKDRKKRSNDFELYSDDSFDEAMAELVDLEEASAMRKKKLAIFRDKLQSSGSTPQSTPLAQDTSQESTAYSGAATPLTSPPGSAEESVFSAVLSSKVKDLRSKFSYSTAALGDTTSTPTFPSASNASSKKMWSVHEEQTEVRSASVKTVSRKVRLEKSTSSVPQEDTVGIDDSAWAIMEAEVVVAASDTEGLEVSLPTGIEVKGSEDLLVPDSEADSEDSPRKPILDLGRFAFCG
jgi:exonuclease-1